MIAVFADTHRTDIPGLSGEAAATVDEADLLVHAGDFTTSAVYDAFEERTVELGAVHGNSDSLALRDRLPAVRTITRAGWTIVIAHGHEHDRTSLSLLARDRNADLAIVGHTHRPAIEELGDQTVLNPGSHADPRGTPATHGIIRPDNDSMTLEIRTAAGDRIDRRAVRRAE